MTANLQTYAQEFTQLVLYLLDEGIGEICGNFLCAEPGIIDDLLGDFPFATVKTKKQVWRGLRWIDADEGHFTRNVVTNDKRIRMLKIDLEIHKELHRLQTQATNEENRNTTPTKKLKNKSKKSNVIKPKTGGVI